MAEVNVERIVELKNLVDDFVLESKQIKISGYPTAFNPSIVRWKERLLLVFRCQRYTVSKFGCIWLDNDFNPVGRPYLLKTRYNNPDFLQFETDPRLIQIEDRLFIAYNNRWKTSDKILERMFIAEIEFQDDIFFLRNHQCLSIFEGFQESKIEKNWVPFEYNGKLLWAYYLEPHRILSLVGNGICQTIASTNSEINWDWGELRGGSPALIDGEHYLAFFHSNLDMKSVESNNKKVSHYFMGAYTYSSTPPFNITAISSKPIIGSHFYSDPSPHRYGKKVIFPAGFLLGSQYVWVVYGKNDEEIWVSKIDKEELIKSLVPVNERSEK